MRTRYRRVRVLYGEYHRDLTGSVKIHKNTNADKLRTKIKFNASMNFDK